MVNAILLVLLASVFFVGCIQPSTNSDSFSENSVVSNAKDNVETGDILVEGGGSVMTDAPHANTADSLATPLADRDLLSGSVATYRAFSLDAFSTAQSEGKIVFLEFYANWCPVCMQQEPYIEAAFSQLSNPNVAGFRVNFNDDQTDETERDLARKYGVSYQHTHVILDGQGKLVTKSLDVWQDQRILDEINKAGV